MSQSFLNSGTLVILCTRVLLLCVVVCKGGGEVSLTGFISRPTQFCVTGSEDRVFWWVRVPGRVRSVGGLLVCIAAVNPGSIPGRRSFVLQVLKTESYHEFESHSVSEVRWYRGEHSCLQSRYPGFDSRAMQFCVTGSEDRVLSWVRLGLGLWLFATASIQILVHNVIHYVPGLLPSHHLQVHNIFHYVPVTHTPPPPPTNSPSSGHLRNQQRRIKYIIWVSGT